MSSFFILGPSGKLEALRFSPEQPQADITCIICHPHPLHQGTMHNKVVTTLGKVCEQLRLHHIKFNYRGVGKSEGVYGDISGEVDDLLAVAEWVKTQRPQTVFWLFGFSFGGYIAAKGATLLPAQQLVTVAPAVSRAPFDTLEQIPCPWVVVQGETDEVVAPEEVFSFVQTRAEQPSVIKMPETSHFFHGRLNELRDLLLAYLVDTHPNLQLD
jgi:hypothetical protein